MGDYAMTLDGTMWSQILRVFDRLPRAVVNKVVAPAAKKAYSPILSRAKAMVPREHGTLRKSLGLVQRRNRRGVYTIVGPRTGYKDADTGENPVNIAHLVEFGTKPHQIAPKGRAGALKIKRGSGPTVYVEGAIQHPGARPRPYIRPAYDAEANNAMRTLERELAAGIMREAERWAARGTK